MIIGVGGTVNTECTLNFGTHNGIFHCDEVVGIAVLEIAHIDIDAYVVRTRNPNELNKLDIVIDIGSGMFDHHMAGFDVCRTTGEKYASAGLVWRNFAEEAIKNVMSKEGVSINDDEIKAIKEYIDREIIIPVDMEDNGEKISSHTFSFVPKFLPSWINPKNYDDAFSKVEKIVYDILREIIRDKVVQIATKKELQKRYDCIDDGILEIPAQTMSWLEDVVRYNESHNYKVKFVIFPYPAGGWAAQCVPPSIDERMAQLVPFPKAWAGGNEETLPNISGIQDAIFCHNGCFLLFGILLPIQPIQKGGFLKILRSFLCIKSE